MAASYRDEQTRVHLEEEDGWAETRYELFGREIRLLPLPSIHPSISMARRPNAARALLYPVRRHMSVRTPWTGTQPAANRKRRQTRTHTHDCFSVRATHRCTHTHTMHSHWEALVLLTRVQEETRPQLAGMIASVISHSILLHMTELAFFVVSLQTTYIIPRTTVYKYEFEMQDVNYSRSIYSMLLVSSNDSTSWHCTVRADLLLVNAAWVQTAIDRICVGAQHYILTTWNYCEARWIQDRI
jgi:hypothetical protein